MADAERIQKALQRSCAAGLDGPEEIVDRFLARALAIDQALALLHATIAPLQKTAWERLGAVPPEREFERPDAEISDLRGLPVWRAQDWGRYADRG